METAPGSRTTGSSSTKNRGSGSTISRTYVCKAINRSLGRVGMPLGSAPVSRTSKSSISSNSNNSSRSKTYVDNSMNRQLGRVSMPLGSAPVSKNLSIQVPEAKCTNTHEATKGLC